MKIVNILYRLMYFIVALLTALVLGFSLVTRMEFLLYEQNDLYVILRENIPLLLVCVVVFLGAVAAEKRREDGMIWRRRNRKSRTSPENVENHSCSDTDAGTIEELSALRSTKSDAADRGNDVDTRPPRGRLFYAALLFAACYSLFLIFLLRGLPTNDANQLNDIINTFMRGDLTSLGEKGSYLDVYSFQITYVMFGQLLHLLFGENNFLPYMLLNVVSITASVWLLHDIAWELSGSRQVCRLTLVLSFGMLAFYTYAPNVYNDIWSMAPQYAALYLEIRWLKSHRTKDMLWSGFWLALAVLIKQNCLITLIAMILIPVMQCLAGQSALVIKNEKQFAANGFLRTVILVICLLAAVKLSGSIVNTAYAKAAGLERFPSGMPRTTHIAMGMSEAQDGEHMKYGWYNGLNVSLYKENGCDYDAADKAAKEFITERLHYFADHPKYAVKFYLYKFLSQWGDPTEGSMRNLEETSRHVEYQPALETSVVYGTGRTLLQWIMNMMHTVIYLCFQLYLADRIRKGRISHGEALIVMMIFGGMLFHELWEASGRYVLRYYVLMLPLAGDGLRTMVRRCCDALNARRM